MDSVLSKRILRDLKQNFGRYVALLFMIIFGIYLVVSIVGSAEVVLIGTENMRAVNKVEDGQFTTFLPLSDDELQKISEGGTYIEETFSLDLTCSDESIVRVFKNREDIDKVILDSGRLPESYMEAVVEKGYAREKNLKEGDTLVVEGRSFKVVGFGSVPDYDQVLKTFSSPAVDSSSFGLIFVSSETYEKIKEELPSKIETYTYAYRLNNITDDELKERIKELDFDYEKVEDQYFKATIEDITNDRDDLENGVSDLCDGAKDLRDGLSELKDNNADLVDGANEVFDAYLLSAGLKLQSLGVKDELTEDNYEEILKDLIDKTDSEELRELKKSLDGLKEFKDGLKEYTDGEEEAYDGSVELSDGTNELKEKTDDLIDEIFDIDIDNLTSFIKAKDNIRIEGAAGDVVMDKNVGLVAGVIILILFAYVISVFIVHQIEREQSVIGALYSLGVKKKDLLTHYIMLPTFIALIGGIIGYLIAISPVGISTRIQSVYDYFSVPDYEHEHPLYLVIYSVLIPPIICAIVNYLTINSKLSRPALSLLRNEQSATNYKRVNLKIKSFTLLFGVRQLLRESRSAITMLLGMFITFMVIALGFNTYILCTRVRDNNTADTKYEYMYLYKYEDKEVPEGGEGTFLKSLSIDCNGYTLDVSVIGIDGSSKYFDAAPEKGKNKAVINSSLVERYGYKKGDKVILSDLSADIDYCFTVSDVSDYSVGFTVFMDLDSMRELFGEDEDYFNVVYSDKELNIDEGKLYSVTTKGDIEKSSGIFIKMMVPLMTMLFAGGIVIFTIVMYLMLAVMIDRSSMGISLIKIFGYRPGEIRKLYLNGNTIVVLAGQLIVFPLSKFVMDRLYPSFISNVACSMRLSYPWYIYLIVFSVVMVIYLIINALLVAKINRISPADVLKNRE
ncbi:MAG: ABC transporter permease [Clostridiales bacterium]|nr:ABC transporter permease [Clostridiales bacterium]